MIPIMMAGISLALGSHALLQTAEQSYFAWTDLPFPADEFVDRRARMTRALTGLGGGLFLAPSGHGTSSGETFRARSDFLYFTGLELPDAVFVLDASTGDGVVFVSRRDDRFENPARPNDFPGRPMSDDPVIARRTGLYIRPIQELREYLTAFAQSDRRLFVNIGHNGPLEMAIPDPNLVPSPEHALMNWLNTVHDFQLGNAYPAVAQLRMVKSDREIAAMRRSAGVTMRAIRHAASLIEPGIDERRLEGELEGSYKRHGAQRPAFASIVKSGPNSLWPWRILASHYDRRNRVLQADDLVIFDVGAELDYYVSDVGRTFPVSGSFTPRQREILSMEVAVSDAIIAAIRPGVTFADLQRVADSAIPDEHRRFMQTGLFFGHHIGLDTGDPSLSDVPLQPGMVFTVEPWYYNHEEGIAVFTEDEVLVTSTGVEVLTAPLPRSPEELEQLTKKRP